MLCVFDSCTNIDLANELLKRGADLILLPGATPDRIVAKFKGETEDGHQENVQILSATMEILQRMIDAEMTFAPDCERCKWRGWEYHDGRCPVCGSELVEHVEPPE